MSISIIVPVYNSEKTLKKCINSLLLQKKVKEIIIVDNDSIDSSSKIINNYKNEKIKKIQEKKRGASFARNAGLKKAKGKYIAFFDSDVIVPKNWTIMAINLLKTNKSIAGVGGPGLSVVKNQISLSLDNLLYGKGKKLEKNYVNSLATMNALYRREYISDIFFSESFDYPAGDDKEFNFRILEKGYKLLFDKSLFVYHHHPTTLKQLTKKWFQYGRYYIIPYIFHKERMNIGFFARVLYFPIFFSFLIFSIINIFFLLLCFVQIISVFLVYLAMTFFFSQGKNRVFFPFVHTIKQLSQSMGIFYSLFERRWCK